MKLCKKDILHILIIIIGMIFISIPMFHNNLWFDESYSVAIANHSFLEIWTIGANDVHPILYYWVLHIINMIFGNNIMLYRIFSFVCASIVGILGFTHIRKDFGKETGMLFSFFSFFLPIIVVYTSELRMYTFAMLLVTLMSIYAYRIYKNQGNRQIKNWILFAIFSLASAYTHYYGLMAAGIINLILFIYFIKKSYNEKTFIYELKVFIVSAIIQIALYITWIISLFGQLQRMSSTHFWIYLKFPDTLIEFFTFQFTGNLEETKNVSDVIAILFSLIFTVYLIYIFIKRKKLKKENKLINKEDISLKLATIVYVGVIVGACLMSIVVNTPIIYARYMLCVTGLFIFFISYYFAKNGNKYITYIICILCVLLSSFIMLNLCKDNYDEINQKPFEYLRDNIQEDDILICSNEGSGFIVSANFPNNFLYFYDEAFWNVEEGYKAFGKHMKTIYSLDDIQDVEGRIWVLDASSYGLLEKIRNEYDVEVIEQRIYHIKYHGFEYSFALIEK